MVSWSGNYSRIHVGDPVNFASNLHGVRDDCMEVEGQCMINIFNWRMSLVGREEKRFRSY